MEPQQRCQCALNTAFCNKEHSLNETCVLDIVGDLNGFDMGGIYSLNIHARTDHSDQEVMSWRQQFGSYFNTSERGMYEGDVCVGGRGKVGLRALRPLNENAV